MQIFETSQIYRDGESLKSAYRGGDEYLKINSNDTTVFDYNVTTAIDLPNPNYGLPLFMDVLETSNNSLKLFNTGYATNNSGIPLHLELEIKFHESSVPLYLQQYDISSSGLDLRIDSHIAAFDSLNLSIDSDVKLSNGIINLAMYNPILTTGILETLDLHLENVYQGGVAGNDDPVGEDVWTIGTRHSGKLNMFIATDPYLDYAKSLNLVIPDNTITISGDLSESIDLFIVGSITEQPISDDPVNNPISGTGNGESLNLFIKSDMGASLPLFVYNTLESATLDLYARGSYQYGSGLNLQITGQGLPSGNITLYTRGFQPYG